MKSLITTIFFLIQTSLFLAQAPQLFNYQGVARDLTGSPIMEQNIGIRISILEDSIDGIDVYKELHLVQTTNLGLFTIQVGNGTPVNNSFSNIEWSNGKHFLMIEIDENGGSNYELVGTSQLLSVPYALYAENSGDGTQWNNNDNGINYNEGNVGIGLSNPSFLLEVGGEPIGDFANRAAENATTIALNDINGINRPLYIINSSGEIDPIDEGRGNYQITYPTDTTGFTRKSLWMYGANLNKMDVSIDGFLYLGGENIGNVNQNVPLKVANGDIYVERITSGIIMKSPSGQCWRYAPNDSGQLESTLVDCPN